LQPKEYTDFMLFNSWNFFIFLIIIYIVYWLISNKRLKAQNSLLLIASYFFYACWDWRFLFLLVFSTFLDYITGLKIEQSTQKRSKKFWFWLSIGINLGFLGVFKYYNFFAENFAQLLTSFGLKVNVQLLNIVLPVGISFYTFHGLSYVIDIYKEKIKAEKNVINYALFVSFFPLLVAGPIERATHLLPQIKAPRQFDYAKMVDGLRQILWGLFKKIVIADNCAEVANQIFTNPGQYNGSTLLLGAIFFTFQIYGDFSGYSDIALGTARLFGIELLKNFNFPYFSRDIAEFWRRWHISLSSWFKDYLYIPLGGSSGGTWMRIRNTFIIFLVSGFWHGANWTFIIWGGLNALFIIPSVITKSNRKNMGIVAEHRLFPNIKETIQLTSTFLLTVFCWIFFRAESLSHAIMYIKNMLNRSLFSFPSILPIPLIILLCIYIGIEWLGRRGNYAIEKIDIIRPRFARWSFYYFILLIVFLFASKGETFIYFQF
jgi:D-alanyl-lipoteichoic acid acyltransferase DltB (MBOAT superfamily)